MSNKRKDINGGEEEQQDSFDFHEDLEWDFVLHLMEEQMFDGGKRLNTSASIIGLHLKGKMLVFVVDSDVLPRCESDALNAPVEAQQLNCSLFLVLSPVCTRLFTKSTRSIEWH